MELRIYRDSALLYQSSDIIDWSFDPLSLSGVDYWSQEARQAKLTLFYDAPLYDLLEGASREVAAGFHTLNFRISLETNLIFAGVLPEGGFSVEYLSLTDKKIELNLLDYFGLLVKLSEDREHQISNPVHPIAELRYILSSCATAQTEEERSSGSPAAVLRLKAALGIPFGLSTQEYDAGSWLPWAVQNYEIYNATSDYLQTGSDSNTLRIFGLVLLSGQLCVYLWQRWSYYGQPLVYNGVSSSFIDVFRLCVYRLDRSLLTLIDSSDQVSYNSLQPLNPPAPLTVMNAFHGTSDYAVSGSALLFSGYPGISALETVPGWYKCKDLLAEYLRLSFAVLLFIDGRFIVRNRLDDSLPVFSLPDPLSASLEESETDFKPSSSPVSVASLALIEAVDRYYASYLISRGLLHEIELQLVDSQLSSLVSLSGSDTPPSNPYDLIHCRIFFDNRLIYPKEVDYNLSTGEITYRGWC